MTPVISGRRNSARRAIVRVKAHNATVPQQSGMIHLPEPGVYRHFKGGEYEVISVGQHTETGELLVVYRPLDSPGRVWVRPLQMFVEPVLCRDGVSARFEREHTT